VTAVATAHPSDPQWEQIAVRAPRLAATMTAYLEQMSVTLRPASIDAVSLALRGFAVYVTTEHHVRQVASVQRRHVEGFKVWLAGQPAGRAKTMSPRTVEHRLGMLRVFFERIIEWGWTDAPKSCPILSIDMPLVDDPLPKFLEDVSAAALMHAAAIARPLDRLVVEILARTGLGAGELCALETNAVVRTGGDHWLRAPVGKLRNDRYLPLHPVLVDLLDNWRASHDSRELLNTDDGRPLDRHHVGRIVRRVARAAGLGNVHPHQLRHTLSTSINRGMSLEAIAALLGHKSLRMTLVYARIADRKVADEYFCHRSSRSALQHHRPGPAGRGRGRADASPADRDATPAARQRLLHSPRRARLPVRVRMRNLRTLRHRTRVRSRHPAPTRPRTRA
jgi:integrase